MTSFEIPLSAGPQRFSLPLNGIDYGFTLYWNTISQNWVLDIDGDDGQPVAHGLPLLTGTSLLDQFEYLGIGGALVVQTDSNLDAVPGFDELGVTGRLYFVLP